MKIQSLRLFALALVCASLLPAQGVDDTQLKQVIIFGRHSVRAAVAPNTYLDQYSAKQFPDFGVAAGILTPNGEALETILGGYYRQWLTQEGLFTGNDIADANFVFFHANVIQRTIDTAQHLWMGMLPGAPASRNSIRRWRSILLWDVSAVIRSRWYPPTPRRSLSRARFCWVIR